MIQFIYKYPRTLALLWALVILGLCATPGQYIPSAGWMDLFNIDKLVHASIFFILVGLCEVVAVKHAQSQAVIALYVILAICYGIVIELMQARYFSQRSADWQDAVANSLGCIVALFLLRKIRKIYRGL